MSSVFETFINPHQYVAHELGHVWDNNSIDSKVATWEGGGLADVLVRYVGGSPVGYRWRNRTSGIPKDYRWKSVIDGNRSTADYFAEAFSWSVFEPTNIPQPEIYLWIIRKVSLTVKY